MEVHENSTRVKAPDTIRPIVQACLQKTNESSSSNPLGREGPDGKNKGCKLIKCKTYLQVGTFNARTLKNNQKRMELANNINKCKLNILGIVDHKIVHDDDPTKIENLQRCTLITTSAWRNTNGAAAGGVGILVDSHSEKSLAEIKPINNRIMVAVFNGNPNTTVVVNYAPVERSEEAEEHYKMLSNVINSIPKRHVIIECGDFNAHLGRDNFKYAFHEKTNSNGSLLLEHATESDLHITNTLFKKKKSRQWTFISDMNGAKSQIDYILVNKKWKNSVHNTEAYNSFSKRHILLLVVWEVTIA